MQTLARPVTDGLAEQVAADGVQFVLAMFVDLHGKPCAKLVPAEGLDRFIADGVGFAGFAAGALGQTPASPDLIALPDPASYVALPFIRPGLGLVQCDLYVEGEPWPYSPRLVLRRTLDRLAARGLSARVGAEAEYFLVRRDAAGRVAVADATDRSPQPCYDARDLTRMYDHLTAVSGALTALGWDNYANDHEDANGQFEQNFSYSDALTTADRIITFRYLVHMLAEQRDMIATFMPKPFSDRTGSGLHMHLSLWDEAGGPLFPAADDPRGLGLSPLAYSFVGGILAHAAAVVALTCPTVNSYKRIGARTTASGATWAPSVATYGGNDRTHLIRVPDGDRVEVRAVDGAANPYLAMTALLAAGLDGIDRGLDPGSPGAADGAVALPPTLLHAAEALGADATLRLALGTVPKAGDLLDHYADLKRQEFLTWHNEVSPAEVDRYLTAI